MSRPRGVIQRARRAGGGAISRPRQLRWATAGFGAAVLVVWELASRGLEIPAYLLPAPTSIAASLSEGLVHGSLLTHLGTTTSEVLAGFAIASVTAIVTALALDRFATFRQIVYPYILGFQAVPKVALAPLFTVWFGLGLTSKVGIAALIAFFPVLVNTLAGLASVDPRRAELFRALGGSTAETYRKLRLPTALPYVFAGLDIAIVFAVVGAIIGEFSGAQAGLGYVIQLSNSNLDTAVSFAAFLLLALLALALHKVLAFARRRIVFWETSEQQKTLSST